MSKAIIELSTLDSVFTRSLALVKAIDAGESAPADYHLGFTNCLPSLPESAAGCWMC